MGEKKAYDQAILETTKNMDHRLNNEGVYYDYEYLIRLLLDMKEDIRKFSKELQLDANGRFKMCSAASSARLTYLYFHNDGDIDFEADLPIDLGDGKKRPSAHPDAYSKKDGIYFECKCHEIFDSHSGEKLSKRYKEVVDRYFGFDAETDGDDLVISQKQLGIGEEDSIYKLHFNVKQLLCHLLGIAERGEPAELRYIFFVPDKADEFIVVRELKDEIEKIKKSPVIQAMCEANRIKFEKIEFINVKEIPDPIYKQLEMKKRDE